MAKKSTPVKRPRVMPAPQRAPMDATPQPPKARLRDTEGGDSTDGEEGTEAAEDAQEAVGQVEDEPEE